MLHRTCTDPDCDARHYAHGLCQRHYTAARTAGGYQTIHIRLTEQLGLARLQRCVDCPAMAAEWSYDYADPDEVRSEAGTRYSEDFEHYQPRCKSCHQTMDQQQRAAELLAAATELQPQIKHAVAERDRARKHLDRQAEDHWDNQLERLTAQLLTG